MPATTIAQQETNRFSSKDTSVNTADTKSGSKQGKEPSPHPGSLYAQDEIPSDEALPDMTPITANKSPYLDSSYETFREGFYVSKISDTLKERMYGVSYKENDTISLDDLRFLSVLYNDFDGNTKTGELVCNKAISQDLLEIFSVLYENGYQIEKMRLVDDYQADDDLSCADNNTSGFNFRVVEGSTKLSKHAYGMAIDINPFFNPYVTFPNGKERISPEGSEPYANRSLENEHMIKSGDLCYQLFSEHGFTWGGNWKTIKDYQHFQKDF